MRGVTPPGPGEEAVVICMRVEHGAPKVPSVKRTCDVGGEDLWVSMQAASLIKNYPQTKPVCVEHGQSALEHAEENEDVKVQVLPPTWEPSQDS